MMRTSAYDGRKMCDKEKELLDDGSLPFRSRRLETVGCEKTEISEWKTAIYVRSGSDVCAFGV